MADASARCRNSRCHHDWSFPLGRFTSVFDAYAGERARLLAQFHNLDRLVAQTDRLTVTTENIKARITDEVWDRQMRWAFKKDVYIRLMETLGQHLNSHEYSAHLATSRGAQQHPDFPMVNADTRRQSQMNQIELTKAACSAPLVISPESHRILIDIQHIQQALLPVNYDAPDFRTPWKHNVAVLNKGLGDLLVAAQKDLGIENSGETPQ